jgi:hypothetical protein
MGLESHDSRIDKNIMLLYNVFSQTQGNQLLDFVEI